MEDGGGGEADGGGEGGAGFAEGDGAVAARAEVVVFGVAAGVASIGEDDAVEDGGIVVVVVVADEHGEYVATLLEGGKQAGVQGRRAAFLAARACKGHALVGSRLCKFRQGDMEKCNRWQGPATVGFGKTLRLGAVPVDLSGLDVIVAFHAGNAAI